MKRGTTVQAIGFIYTFLHVKDTCKSILGTGPYVYAWNILYSSFVHMGPSCSLHVIYFFFFFVSLFNDLFSPSNPNPTTNRLINQKGVPFLSPCCSSSPMFSLSHSHTYILYESPSAYHVITISKKIWPVRAFWCLKYVQLCHNHDHLCKYANFFITTLTFS